MTDAWKDWWRRRGQDRLSLLLWAVWNPIGPVPLDEYTSYTGTVVTILPKAHAADQNLTGGGNDFSDFVQRQRNKLSESTVGELLTVLANLGEKHMGMPPNTEADRRTAETLLDWYDWEMQGPTD
ncbi:MAG TPA: hypothetical protein VH108_06020 [Gaiellaceae bacterium]|jgi:hypothetical protein|nr:hypothetical protein [Gaiellaceae bacterium]